MIWVFFFQPLMSLILVAVPLHTMRFSINLGNLLTRPGKQSKYVTLPLYVTSYKTTTTKMTETYGKNFTNGLSCQVDLELPFDTDIYLRAEK